MKLDNYLVAHVEFTDGTSNSFRVEFERAVKGGPWTPRLHVGAWVRLLAIDHSRIDFIPISRIEQISVAPSDLGELS